MYIRSTKPGAGDKYFIRKASGGYSSCITGKPKDANCDVLANCVGFACGAFNETCGYGYEKYNLNCNAENFIERAISLGLSVVKDPVKGGIMVWAKGKPGNSSDGAGHVAYVRDDLIKGKTASGDKAKTSESGYGGSAFWTATRSRGTGNWGAGTGYTYRGCIVNPKVPVVVPTPTPEPTPVVLKFKKGDVVTFSGILYGDSYGNKPGQSRKGLKATISTVNSKGSKPYNINKGLGWVAESDLTAYVTPTTPVKPSSGLAVGNIVKIVGTGNGNSFGTAGKAGGIGWKRTILAIHKGRAFPYQVGTSTGTTGFYPASSLQKL